MYNCYANEPTPPPAAPPPGENKPLAPPCVFALLLSANEEGKLEIVLENTGSVHQMLNGLSIVLTGDNGAEYTLSETDLEPVSGQNLLTDSKLRTVIEMPEALAGASSIQAAIEYNYSYSA